MKRIGTSLITLISMLGLSSVAQPAWAQRACIPTLNQCSNQTVTTSRIQIGGAGSLSSAGTSFSNPGRLDDGTIAEADYDFTFDRSTGRLTLVASNRTTSTASLTAIGFNATTDVTLVTLISQTGSLPWQLGFDRDRTDNKVEVPANTNLKEFKMDGFGRLSVFLGNKGIDTGGNGGDKREILAGHSVTFVMQVSGNLSSLTACSFTSVGSYIPPGDKIVTAVGRFQAGVQGGSAFIGPCTGGGLLVSLSSFLVDPLDGAMRASWATASEVDNAGFALLLKDVRTGTVRRATSTLVPGQGDSASGATYEYLVKPVPNGRKYEVSLEDWDTHGFNTIHRPALAVPNPSNPEVSLISPAYEAVAGSSVSLKWQSSGRRTFAVEISGDATFARQATLRIPVGTRTERTLTEREMTLIRSMASAGESGVYWRVVGKDFRGAFSVSQVYFLEVGE